MGRAGTDRKQHGGGFLLVPPIFVHAARPLAAVLRNGPFVERAPGRPLLDIPSSVNRRSEMENDLQGKNALITGGSRGIGRAIAEGVAERGAAVAVNYRENETAALKVV